MQKKIKPSSNPPKRYSWKSIDLAGNEVTGIATAKSKTQLKQQLIQQGFSPIKIQTLFTIRKQHTKKISHKNIQLFFRQLTQLLKSGVPLERSLFLMSNGSHHQQYVDLINHISNDVKAGMSLSDSLKKNPRFFSNITCTLIHTGEQTGALIACLEKINQFEETRKKIKQKINKAIFYPTCVLVIALLISLGLLLFVVPQFQSIFSNFEAKLPWLTQHIILFSNLIQQRALFILTTLGFLAFAVTLLKTKMEKHWQHMLEFLKLHLPFLNSFYLNHLVTSWCLIIATTLQVGIPLSQAMAMGNVSIKHPKIKSRFILAMRSVENGKTLHHSLSQTLLFDEEDCQLIQIGEESGQLAEMLNHISIAKEKKLNGRLEKLTTLFEPILMLIIATLVGGFIVAMYLPIFKLGSIM